MPSRDRLPLRLREHVIGGLQSLLRVSPHIEAISKACSSTRPGVTLSSLSERIGRELGVPEEDVFDSVVALWNLRQWQEGRDETEEEFIGTLTEAIEKQLAESWTNADLDKWKTVSKTVTNVLASLSPDHPISVSYKAQSLAYTHQNILMSARVITDVRPVFNEARDKILETVILHRLSVQYSSGHHEPSLIEFALDSQDLRMLREECERAEQKEGICIESLRPNNLNPVTYPDGWNE